MTAWGPCSGKQQKKLKKDAQKEAEGKGTKGGWLVSNDRQHHATSPGQVMGNNRDRFTKGMKLVTGGIATKLSTGVTPLTTDVHVVYFGGGWRLEDTGTTKTATLNGQQVTRCDEAHPWRHCECGRHKIFG